MIAPLSARRIADQHHRREVVPARRLPDQADLAAAVLHLEVEARHRLVRQRRVALRPVVVRIASRDRMDENAVAPHAHFRLVVDLKADVALALARRHIVASHTPDSKLRVRHRGQTKRRAKQHGPDTIESCLSHCLQHIRAAAASAFRRGN